MLLYTLHSGYCDERTYTSTARAYRNERCRITAQFPLPSSCLHLQPVLFCPADLAVLCEQHLIHLFTAFFCHSHPSDTAPRVLVQMQFVFTYLEIHHNKRAV